MNPKIAAMPRTSRVLLNTLVIILGPVIIVLTLLVLPVVALLVTAGLHVWKFLVKAWSHLSETALAILLTGKFLGFAVLFALIGLLIVSLASYQMTTSIALRIIYLFICLAALFLFAIIGRILSKQVSYLRYAIRTKGRYWRLQETRDEMLSENRPDDLTADSPDRSMKLASYIVDHGATLIVAAASLVLVGSFGMFLLLSVDLSLLAPQSLFTGRELTPHHNMVWVRFVVEQMLRSIPVFGNLVPNFSGIEPVFPWGHLYFALLQLGFLGTLIMVGFMGYFAVFVERSFGEHTKKRVSPSQQIALSPASSFTRPQDYDRLLREENAVAASLLATATVLFEKAGYEVVDASEEVGSTALRIGHDQQRVFIRPFICYRSFDESTLFETLQIAAVSPHTPVVFVSCGMLSEKLAVYANQLHPTIRFADLDLNHNEDQEQKIVLLVEELLQRQNAVGIEE
ncbi:MAG: hypothetical protein PHI18_03790 [bacterium]|nr:hypothetical protein [bacterium]